MDALSVFKAVLVTIYVCVMLVGGPVAVTVAAVYSVVIRTVEVTRARTLNRLTSKPASNSRAPRLILATGEQARVVVVLTVLLTVESEVTFEVTAFGVLVTVFPGTECVETVLVVVTALGLETDVVVYVNKDVELMVLTAGVEVTVCDIVLVCDKVCVAGAFVLVVRTV